MVTSFRSMFDSQSCIYDRVLNQNFGESVGDLDGGRSQETFPCFLRYESDSEWKPARFGSEMHARHPLYLKNIGGLWMDGDAYMTGCVGVPLHLFTHSHTALTH